MKTTTGDPTRIRLDGLNGIQRARLTLRLLRDPRVATWTKATAPAIALIYLVLPIDLIPDFILGLGQIDDLSVIGIAIFAMTRILPRLAPREIVMGHLDEMKGNGRARSNQRTDRASIFDAAFRVVNDQPRRRSEG